MRKFDKINFEQFCKDVKEDKILYDRYVLPVRQTKYSAGYDIMSLIEITILPGEQVKIPTGIKVTMEENEVLLLVVRSSLGIRNHIQLSNQIGVIDCDYYNNINNEGHIWVTLTNVGTELHTIHQYDRIVQGIFTKYLTVDDEKVIEKIRTDGTGSTTKGAI